MKVKIAGSDHIDLSLALLSIRNRVMGILDILGKVDDDLYIVIFTDYKNG